MQDSSAEVPGTTASATAESDLHVREGLADGSRRVEIVAIAGSLRTGSWARALLRAAANRVPTNVELNIWDDLELVPPFNEDRESGPTDPAVASLRDAIDRADALLIVTPEYNGSFPGVLKNALDWASRPYGSSVLQRTPIAAVGTSPLPSGGENALGDLKRVLTRIRADVVDAELAVPLVHSRIDDSRYSDPELATQVDRLLAKLADHVRRGMPVLVDA
jgi:chromate reductase, NAD(P)H dehydrogenase (quinone)